ncbi:hypothetical protein MBLNU230_g5842t1 [Neophaeotheca triangularis]
MAPPIPFAVIGTGWITDSWITAAHKSSQWQLSAVYSRTAETASSFASKHNCSKTHTTLESLASDPSITTVYIASPNASHHAQAKQMLVAKKHVILEKPATSTTTELADLFTIANTHGVFLLEAYRHIQESNFKLLRRLLHTDKLLGPLQGASLTYASYSSRYTPVLNNTQPPPNIFNPTHGGGSLVDIGVYPLAFACGLFGAPKSQTYAPHICSTGVDAGGPLLLHYDNFGVSVNNSKAYNSTAPCEIYGEKGTLVVNATADISSIRFLRFGEKGEGEELAGPKRSAEKPNVNMEEEAEEFARVLNEGDSKAAAELERLSRTVLEITQDLRRKNGILFPADRRELGL